MTQATELLAKEGQLAIQQWSPTLRRYGAPVSRTLAGRASSTRFTGLVTGRPYRFSVAEHNAAGYSAWSDRSR